MSAPFAHKPPFGAAARNVRRISPNLALSLAVPESDLSDQAARARSLYVARRRRDELLPEVADLLHEPVWDILLDLFVAGERGESVSVTSACIASVVPTSTALRILWALQERDVVVIEPDPSDRRRRYVRLSAPTHRHMADYLAQN